MPAARDRVLANSAGFDLVDTLGGIDATAIHTDDVSILTKCLGVVAAVVRAFGQRQEFLGGLFGFVEFDVDLGKCLAQPDVVLVRLREALVDLAGVLVEALGDESLAEAPAGLPKGLLVATRFVDIGDLLQRARVARCERGGAFVDFESQANFAGRGQVERDLLVFARGFVLPVRLFVEPGQFAADVEGAVLTLERGLEVADGAVGFAGRRGALRKVAQVRCGRADQPAASGLA